MGDTKPRNLAHGLRDELERNLDLLLAYKEIDALPNACGAFAMAAIWQTTRDTGDAILAGDLPEMIRCYERLKAHE